MGYLERVWLGRSSRVSGQSLLWFPGHDIVLPGWRAGGWNASGHFGVVARPNFQMMSMLKREKGPKKEGWAWDIPFGTTVGRLFCARSWALCRVWKWKGEKRDKILPLWNETRRRCPWKTRFLVGWRGIDGAWIQL